MKWTSFLLATSMIPTTLLAAPMVIDEAWDSVSDPEIMSYFFIKDFNSLPLSGTVTPSEKYWSGDYWALKKGNINYRWYARNKVGFNLNSPDMDRARKMSIPELAELSPSEKYDLFTGRYDYPLRNEVNRIADPGAEIWEGICHGWSPATMNHNEPKSKLLRNPDGIEIPFGSSDIKALISYYYAYGFQALDTHQMGRRCFKEGKEALKDRDCNDDLNAGAFHVVLANRVGKDGKGFIADLQRFKEVWNHPVTSYKSIITGRTSAGVKVKTTITYVDENGHDWQPVKATPKQQFKTTDYEYLIELDQTGKITGGEWISKNRPDFLWLVSRPREFSGTLSRLEELLDD